MRAAGAGRDDRAGPGRRDGSHRHRTLTATLGVGALLCAVTAAASTLGYSLTSGGPLSLLDLGSRPPAPVAGLPGLAPGGPGQQITFLVAGPADTTITTANTADPATLRDLTVTTLTPEGANLPLGCPASAWEVTLPAPLHLATPALPTKAVFTVALSDEAPVGCQGITAAAFSVGLETTGPGGVTAHLESTAETSLQTALLGTPGIAVGEQQGHRAVLTTADPHAPAGTHYTVEVRQSDGSWSAACHLASPVPCVTAQTARQHGTPYRVTARLGNYWRRTSVTLTS